MSTCALSKGANTTHLLSQPSYGFSLLIDLSELGKVTLYDLKTALSRYLPEISG